MRSCTPAPKPAPHAHEDDLAPGLPPMDGDDDDREEDAEGLTDEEMLADDGDPFDDATGEGDAVPELLGDAEGGESMLDAADADGLDVGAADLVGSEGDRLTGDDGTDESPMEDYGLGDDRSVHVLDAGEEGPSTLDESLSSEGLPPLDADEDGAPDEAEAFFDHDLTHAGRDAWAPPWERFGAPLALPLVRALVLADEGVLAAGRELLRIDLEGGVERLAARGLGGGDATRVAVAGPAILVTTERGELFASKDRGATFTEVTGWRNHVRPEEAAAGLEVVASSRGIWGRTAKGALLFSLDGAAWEKSDEGGFARALGIDDAGNAIALVQALGVSELLRWQGRGWARTGLPADLLASGLTGRALVAARGRTLAIAIEGDAVFRAIAHRSWERLPATEKATSLALLDASGGLMLGMEAADGEPQSSLVHIGANGKPVVVATWDEREGSEGGIRAIAVDEAHQVVWVGGGFGVTGFQPRIRGPE